MSVARARRPHQRRAAHHFEGGRHRAHGGRRSDQALFILIITVLAVAAILLGMAASLFQP